MSSKQRVLKRPEDMEDLIRLKDRFQWNTEATALVLGHSARLIRNNWIKDRRTDVPLKDIAFLRRIEVFLDSIEGMLHVEDLSAPSLPASKALGEEFTRLILTFGWNPFDDRVNSRPPFFAAVSGIPGPVVRRMATGKEDIPGALMAGLRELAAEVPEKAREIAEDSMQILLNPMRREDLEKVWAAERAAAEAGEGEGNHG